MSKIIQKLAASKERKNIIKDKTNLPVTSAPKLSVNVGQTRAQENKKRKAENSNPSAKTITQTKDSRVIYLGHVPNGFGESEMRKFFSQFGLVKRIKLFRSAKTGGSKGFAFVEFESAETARIVADAMNGYYLLERQVVSHVIPSSKHHDGMFKSTKRKLSETDSSSVVKGAESDVEDKAAEELNEEQLQKAVTVHRSSMRNKQKKLAELGIDFDITIPV